MLRTQYKSTSAKEAALARQFLHQPYNCRVSVPSLHSKGRPQPDLCQMVFSTFLLFSFLRGHLFFISSAIARRCSRGLFHQFGIQLLSDNSGSHRPPLATCRCLPGRCPDDVCIGAQSIQGFWIWMWPWLAFWHHLVLFRLSFSISPEGHQPSFGIFAWALTFSNSIGFAQWMRTAHPSLD